ncbi:hypothetical protein PHSY_003411 [Pseudozyma hubeiensis SY62]|uniref:Uncharacterized protein n=1 Tax=Pseudozyma hubeiensis (strain SY62) TaxID=1305764 RepID=R9P3I2_PSEHS|nr:hypothetical protein PHSY_003411 [Pseudozyma hubeiensis SY62]GAC95834.1 hypothetical protein PHSY_003411 [Pseudozyma hubeiensis SY62]
MRSLVFLPPPALTSFPSGSSHSTLTSAFTIPSSHRSHIPRVIADETRPDPLANETLEEVPDSVDPHLANPISDHEESVATSEVLDAPKGVPWEILHAHLLPTARDAIRKGEDGSDAQRDRKRVRIRSPVLVIETPERQRASRQRTIVMQDSGSGHDGKQDSTGEDASAGDDVDKSRVIVEDDSFEQMEQHGQDGDTTSSVGALFPPAVLADETTNASDSRRIASGNDTSAASQNALDAQPDLNAVQDTSLLAGFSASGAASRSAPATSVSRDRLLLSALAPTEAEDSNSASSLLVKPPIPAAIPAQTCRFTFFSKRPSLAPTCVTSDVGRDQVELPAPNPTQPHVDAANQAVNITQPAKVTTHERLGESSLHQTLPTLNDFAASFDSHPYHPHTLPPADESHSIQPPPTLHFNLGGITPVAQILANPMHFLTHGSGGAPRSGVGGVSSKINLLVVVKEVGEVQSVRNRFPVDAPPPRNRTTALRPNNNRSEMRSGMSSAFRAAAAATTHKPDTPHTDGRTLRATLLVMDGRISSIPRLVDTQSLGGEWSLIEEVEERSLFQVVLWGDMVRQWIVGDQEADGSDSILRSTSAPGQAASTLTPTPLRAGDVISLTNLNLSRSTSIPQKRLGSHPHPSHKPTLVAHASGINSSAIELCYRTQVDTSRDAGRNFDSAVEVFDLRSRRVGELGRLWKASR